MLASARERNQKAVQLTFLSVVGACEAFGSCHAIVEWSDRSHYRRTRTGTLGVGTPAQHDSAAGMSCQPRRRSVRQNECNECKAPLSVPYYVIQKLTKNLPQSGDNVET